MQYFAVAATSFVMSLLLVPLARWVSHKRGWTCRVTADRWSQREVALLGGVAIFAAYVIALLVVVPLEPNNQWSIVPLGGLLFIVGLIDDFIKIRPASKLIGQIVGASLAVYLGHVAPLPHWPLLSVPLSIFWIVAVTNAYNLIDNMDGLAAGVGAISVAFMCWIFLQEGQAVFAMRALALLGALVGFLIYNFNPASIFMGDAGSMFIGFTLALLSLHSAASPSGLAPVAVPLLILLVPVLDMSLVSATRILTGRSVAQGGRDHSSHRLVLLGLSERKAVLVLWLLAVLAGVSGILVKRFSTIPSFLVLAGAIIAFALIGFYLSQMSFSSAKGYFEGPKAKDAATAFMVDLTFKRRLFEVVLDFVLIVFSYCLAYGLRFDFAIPPGFVVSLKQSLPLVVVATFLCFFIAGVYRGLWRFTGLRELVTFAAGSAAAAIVSVFIAVLIYRFENFSRSVFPLYGLLLFTCVAASRLSMRVLSGVIVSLRPEREDSIPALIYGAGDVGEMLAAELRRNQGPGSLRPVGFLDDSEGKLDVKIHGLRVLGGISAIEKALKITNFRQLLLSSEKIEGDNLRRAVDFCREHDIAVKRYRWVSEDVG